MACSLTDCFQDSQESCLSTSPMQEAHRTYIENSLMSHSLLLLPFVPSLDQRARFLEDGDQAIQTLLTAASKVCMPDISPTDSSPLTSPPQHRLLPLTALPRSTAVVSDI